MDGTILTAATAGPVASTPMGWWLTPFDALPPNITDSGGAMPNMWSGPMASHQQHWRHQHPERDGHRNPALIHKNCKWQNLKQEPWIAPMLVQQLHY